jgi:hypothetical protein
MVIGAGTILSFCFSVVAFFMPESPYWLIMKVQQADAGLVLGKISNSKEEAKLGLKERENGGEWTGFISNHSVSYILIGTICIHLFQAAAQIGVIVLYGRVIFEIMCVHTLESSLISNLVLGCIKTSFTLVAMFSIDRKHST